MQIRIVTLEREYGSGGANIAKTLAARLGWKVWDEDLTAEIARVALCPAAVDPSGLGADVVIPFAGSSVAAKLRFSR